MPRFHLDQKGFSWIESLLVLVVLGIIAVIGIYIADRHTTATNNNVVVVSRWQVAFRKPSGYPVLTAGSVSKAGNDQSNSGLEYVTLSNGNNQIGTLYRVLPTDTANLPGCTTYANCVAAEHLPSKTLGTYLYYYEFPNTGGLQATTPRDAETIINSLYDARCATNLADLNGITQQCPVH